MAGTAAELPKSELALARTSAPELGPDGGRALAESLGLCPTVGRIFTVRGLTDPAIVARFLQPRLADLTPPNGMADRSVAAGRLARAVRGGERVAVFGDYDCDGITSVAILTGTLTRLGVPVTPLLASRFDGGYGVTPAAAARIVASGARLLVTCDCGSSDHDVLEDLGRSGIDVIVIDHHLVPDRPLPVLAFLNPHRPECGFPYLGLASCGLALSIVAALRAELGVELDVRTELDLVAIGTIADVAPLDGDNRVLVRAGLSRLRRPARPGLRALAEVAGLTGDLPITSEDVAFRLAPRLNAPGRLGAPDAALELLLCTDTARAQALAAALEQGTIERRRQQDEILAAARAELAEAPWAGEAGLVLGREGWNHGIVGIVAGRLAAELARPVVVIGFDAAGVGRGSVRGPAGFPLFDAVSAVAPLLERFGGHQAAAGLEVRAGLLDELRAAFAEACARVERGPVVAETAIALEPGDDPARILRDMEGLEPFGEGNPRPRFRASGVVVTAKTVRGGHLKLELRLPDGTRLAGFAAGNAGSPPKAGATVAAEGTLRWDRWRGGGAVEMGIDRLDPV